MLIAVFAQIQTFNCLDETFLLVPHLLVEKRLAESRLANRHLAV